MAAGLSVLIIEDSKDDADLIVRALTADYDLRCRRVDNSEDIKTALKAQDWDIVIADYKLPHLNGFEALRIVQETGLDIPFIAVSGVIDEETVVRIMKAGAHDCVKKDNLSRLVPSVKRELAQAEIRRHHYRDVERLKETDIFIKDILDSLPFEVAVLDKDGVVVAVNEEWRNFAKTNGLLDSNYYVGSNYLVIVRDAAKRQKDDIAAAAVKGIKAVMDGTEEFFSLEYPCHSPEIKRWFVMRVSPLSGKKEGAVIAHIDITLDKLAKEEQRKLELQLLQTQKYEALGQLAAGAAHDFNNMLFVIAGYTGMGLRYVEPSGSIYGYLIEIRKAVKQAEELVRQLLAFARKQVVEPISLHINEIIVPMLDMLRTLLEGRNDLIWKPGEFSWRCRVDPVQINQILTNLMSNARDAIVDRGQVTVETSTRTVDRSDDPVHRGLSAGEYVLLTVGDNGCGMDERTIARIFEPFFTTKQEGKGTGLGLSTVYGIVKQNGGFVYATSRLGKGTTFEIYLPRYKSDQETAERALAGDNPVS